VKRADQISRRLRLKDLHTLQIIAELGSMAKASHQLALSQPAISKAVSEMERTVGVRSHAPPAPYRCFYDRR